MLSSMAINIVVKRRSTELGDQDKLGKNTQELQLGDLGLAQ